METEYTPELVQSLQGRIHTLEAIIKVTKKVSSILDQEILLDTSVHLIWDYFHIYHNFLYLLDDAQKWAVVRAGTGEVGRHLVASNHKVKISDATLVG